MPEMGDELRRHKNDIEHIPIILLTARIEEVVLGRTENRADNCLNTTLKDRTTLITEALR